MANEKMVSKLCSLNERISSRSLVLGTVSASASETEETKALNGIAGFRCSKI